MSRVAGWVLLVLAALGLAACAYLALGTQGDLSIRSLCRGPAVRGWVDPQPHSPAGGTDYGQLCNEDAATRLHEVVVALPVSLLVGVGGRRLVRRRVVSTA